MKKSTKRNLAITGSVIFLILIASLILYIIGFPQAIIPSQIHSTTTNLETSDENSATYLFDFVSEPMGRSDCNERSPDSFDINVPTIQSESQLPEFIEWIEENKDFETTEVEISGLSATAGICSDLARGVSTEVRNQKAICKISKGILIQGIPRANINCRFTGDVYAMENGNQVSAKIMGLNGGSARIKISRYEDETCPTGKIKCSDGICRDDCNIIETCSTDSSICNSDQTCENDVCIDKKTPDNILKYLALGIGSLFILIFIVGIIVLIVKKRKR